MTAAFLWRKTMAHPLCHPFIIMKNQELHELATLIDHTMPSLSGRGAQKNGIIYELIDETRKLMMVYIGVMCTECATCNECQLLYTERRRENRSQEMVLPEIRLAS